MMNIEEENLDILAENIEDLELTAPRRRSSRKRSFTQIYQHDPNEKGEPMKKRSNTPNLLTEAAIEKFYKNQTRVRSARQDLETIFEDPTPSETDPNESFGCKKKKRSITFPMEYKTTTKQKQQYRRKRIKRLGLNGVQKKLTNDEFNNRLQKMDNYLEPNNSWCTTS